MPPHRSSIRGCEVILDHNSEAYRRLVHRLADLADQYQQVGQDYYKTLRDYGTGELYTSTEVHMVTRIEENPGITASKIAEDTLRTKSAVSQMIAKLEAKGLVYREKDPNNGKQHFLYVTEKGNRLSQCHKIYDEKSSPIEDLVNHFGMETMEAYANVVDYLIQTELLKKGK